jgi:very-short-patch-repair endonuclease
VRGAKASKTAVARKLRLNSTDAELRLWGRLRSRAVDGCKFVRQEPIGSYVVDFVCRERRLIVEVDGGQHAGSEHDRIRDEWLEQHNYRVLRFWNNDVLANTNGIFELILAALKAETPPHPDRFAVRPLPASGER